MAAETVLTQAVPEASEADPMASEETNRALRALGKEPLIPPI